MRKLISILSIFSLALFCGYNIHRSTHRFDGIVGMTKKNGSGCYCHDSTATASVSVWIAGPDTVPPGEERMYTLFVARDSSVAAGFNVATELGFLGAVDSSEVYWYEDELTHVHPKLATESDTISWEFRYRAPGHTDGLVDTIFSVANVVNLDTMATEADTWDFGENFLVQVSGTTDVRDQGERDNANAPQSFRLYQNYPNPFNPETTISFELPVAASITLTVYDLAGCLVKEVARGDYDPGLHHIVVETARGENLASGIYFYELRAHRGEMGIAFVATGKMLHVK